MSAISINKPEDFTCSIYVFQRRHGILFVEMRNEDFTQIHYVRFSQVRYFSGLTWWRNASMEEIEGAEKINLFRQVFPIKTEGALIAYHLYRFFGAKPVVEIIAYDAQFTDEVDVKAIYVK